MGSSAESVPDSGVSGLEFADSVASDEEAVEGDAQSDDQSQDYTFGRLTPDQEYNEKVNQDDEEDTVELGD